MFLIKHAYCSAVCVPPSLPPYHSIVTEWGVSHTTELQIRRPCSKEDSEWGRWRIDLCWESRLLHTYCMLTAWGVRVVRQEKGVIRPSNKWLLRRRCCSCRCNTPRIRKCLKWKWKNRTDTLSMFYKRHPIRDVVLILERLRDSL